MTALHWAGLLVLVGVASGSPQSNYNLQDLNIEFEGEGLPEFATLDASVVELGEEIFYHKDHLRKVGNFLSKCKIVDFIISSF